MSASTTSRTKSEKNVDKTLFQGNRITNGSFASNRGIIQPNMNNLGGRHLITTLNHKHMQTLKQTKKQVDNSLPWSYQQKSAKLHNISRNRSSTPTKDKNSPASSPKKSSSKSPQKRQPSPKKKRERLPRFDPEFDFQEEDQQKVYEAFVKLLCDMGENDCAAVSNAAIMEAQERILLKSYNGVTPKFFDNVFVNPSETASEDQSDTDYDNYLNQEDDPNEENGSSNYGDDEMNEDYDNYSGQLLEHDYDDDL